MAKLNEIVWLVTVYPGMVILWCLNWICAALSARWYFDKALWRNMKSQQRHTFKTLHINYKLAWHIIRR